MAPTTAPSAADIAAGTVVTIAKYGERAGVVWTIVGPTRHPYAVVVRESEHGTTVHVNISEITVR